jgi:mono/diheme cytochrome c family protein
MRHVLTRLLCACLLVAGNPAIAQEKGDAARGQAFARANCAECHAIAPDQRPSPLAKAPPFSDIANARGMSEIALFPFFQTPHVSMPNFVIAPDDIRDVTAYLMTLRR